MPARDPTNVNGLLIEGADTGRPMLRALWDDEHPEGREATVAELAFWRALAEKDAEIKQWKVAARNVGMHRFGLDIKTAEEMAQGQFDDLGERAR